MIYKLPKDSAPIALIIELISKIDLFKGYTNVYPLNMLMYRRQHVA